MAGFTDRFGGSTLQAAQVAYRALTLTASAALSWPAYATKDDYLARLMDVLPSGAGLTLSLPSAQLATVGQDAFFSNKGSQAFTLLDFAGNAVAVVAPGAVRYVYLTSVATAAGAWTTVLFGVGASTLDASQFTGAGLKAINNTLNQAAQVNSVASSRAVITNERASVLVWTGGSGTLTLPSLALAGSDWFMEVRNQGSGVLTLAPVGGDPIDAGAQSLFQISEAAFVHAGPGSYYTVGKGRTAQFNFTQLTKTLSGGAATLSLTEAANVVQTYTGALASNAVVTLPAVVQVYYVSNQTSGAFSLTFRNPATGATVNVPTGQNAVLFSDGINVINASTTLAGLSALNLGPGSAAAPSLSISQSNLGLYSSGTNQLGVAVGGAQVANFTASGMQAVGSNVVGLQAVSTGSTAILSVDRPAGQVGRLVWRTSGADRWIMDANATAETGVNAGSDFFFHAMSDAGAILSTPLSISRSTGVMNLGQPLRVTSGGTGATTASAALANLSGVAQTVFLPNGVDLNTIVTSGFYRLASGTVNGPLGSDFSQLIVSRGGDTVTQILSTYSTNRTHTRAGNPVQAGGGGSFSAWDELISMNAARAPAALTALGAAAATLASTSTAIGAINLDNPGGALRSFSQWTGAGYSGVILNSPGGYAAPTYSLSLANCIVASNIGNGNPGFNFDANDFMDYDRANNSWRIVITEEKFKVDSFVNYTLNGTTRHIFNGSLQSEIKNTAAPTDQKNWKTLTGPNFQLSFISNDADNTAKVYDTITRVGNAITTRFLNQDGGRLLVGQGVTDDGVTALQTTSLKAQSLALTAQPFMKFNGSVSIGTGFGFTPQFSSGITVNGPNSSNLTVSKSGRYIISIEELTASSTNVSQAEFLFNLKKNGGFYSYLRAAFTGNTSFYRGTGQSVVLDLLAGDSLSIDRADGLALSASLSGFLYQIS